MDLQQIKFLLQSYGVDVEALSPSQLAKITQILSQHSNPNNIPNSNELGERLFQAIGLPKTKCGEDNVDLLTLLALALDAE